MSPARPSRPSGPAGPRRPGPSGGPRVARRVARAVGGPGRQAPHRHAAVDGDDGQVGQQPDRHQDHPGHGQRCAGRSRPAADSRRPGCRCRRRRRPQREPANSHTAPPRSSPTDRSRAPGQVAHTAAEDQAGEHAGARGRRATERHRPSTLLAVRAAAPRTELRMPSWNRLMDGNHLILHSPVGFVVAFGAGIVSFLSPCVLPLVPAYLSMMSGVSSAELAVGDPARPAPPAALDPAVRGRLHRRVRGPGGHRVRARARRCTPTSSCSTRSPARSSSRPAWSSPAWSGRPG